MTDGAGFLGDIPQHGREVGTLHQLGDKVAIFNIVPDANIWDWTDVGGEELCVIHVYQMFGSSKCFTSTYLFKHVSITAHTILGVVDIGREGRGALETLQIYIARMEEWKERGLIAARILVLPVATFLLES